jgi:hypothetical protein
VLATVYINGPTLAFKLDFIVRIDAFTTHGADDAIQRFGSLEEAVGATVPYRTYTGSSADHRRGVGPTLEAEFSALKASKDIVLRSGSP